ncbi:hypothetical protein ACGFY3_32130 [Streptomyces mirabilis]
MEPDRQDSALMLLRADAIDDTTAVPGANLFLVTAPTFHDGV